MILHTVFGLPFMANLPLILREYAVIWLEGKISLFT